jgi:hypothetical protein
MEVKVLSDLGFVDGQSLILQHVLVKAVLGLVELLQFDLPPSL